MRIPCICDSICVYAIRFWEGVIKDLGSVRPYDRNKILDAIQQQLVHPPNVETRDRKLLLHLIPPFEAVPPIWELRIGEYRIFYDVNQEDRTVYVRAIRHQPTGKTVEEIR